MQRILCSFRNQIVYFLSGERTYIDHNPTFFSGMIPHRSFTDHKAPHIYTHIHHSPNIMSKSEKKNSLAFIQCNKRRLKKYVCQFFSFFFKFFFLQNLSRSLIFYKNKNRKKRKSNRNQHFHQHWPVDDAPESVKIITERCQRTRINSAIFVSSEGRGFDSIEFIRRYGSQSVLCRKARSAENITAEDRNVRNHNTCDLTLSYPINHKSKWPPHV
jgi:Domain of unknown function (DUF4808)